MRLRILNCGCCELFKAGVHGAAFGLAAVMGLYNAAAWVRRREPHLAVNAILYAALTAWEHQHMAHHLRQRLPTPELLVDDQSAPLNEPDAGTIAREHAAA